MGRIESAIGYFGLTLTTESEPEDVDLAEHSKQVGKSMSVLGLVHTVLSLQISANEHLRSSDSFRWTD